jgi:hypothetical protein
MISPRILFEGNPTEAYKYVGIAKDFGRSTFAAGIISKVWRLGNEVQIRVLNNIASRICKVWITAGSPGLWYQFITTGPDRESLGSGLFSSFKGSAVAIKCPSVEEGEAVDWGTVKPLPTGSTLETLPNGTPPGTNNREIQRVKGVVQVNLVTEPTYQAFIDDDPFKYQQLLYSWASMPGQIYNAGALSPAPTFGYGDKTYDTHPNTISSRRFINHEPNTDWPHDAMILRVASEEFGTRSFIVMVDASQRFYCFPRGHTVDTGLESPYAEQNQSVNIPDDQVQWVDPPFPEWVYVPVGDRRDTDWPIEVNSGEPRYVWRFHPQGTKVVGLVLSREAFAGELWIENVTNNGSGDLTDESYVEVDWEFSAETIHGVSYTGIPKTDLPGYVEFSIDIVITGAELTDFTFGLTLLQDQLANANHYPIAADYLSPVVNGWEAYGVSGAPGNLVVMEIEARKGPMSELWWKMEGSSERPERYFRQIWAKVIHVGTATVLRKFLILDQPDDYLHSCAYIDVEEQFILSGALVGMDLSKLAFTYQARRKRFFVDSEEYYAIEYNTSFGFWFGLRQRWMEEEAGIRVYAFNQVVKEVRAGESFNLWSTLDAVSVESVSVVASPLEIGRKSLLPSVGGFSNKNILAYLLYIPYARHVTEEFIVGTPPDEYAIRTTISYDLLNPENTDDLEYATYNAFYAVIINGNAQADPELIKSDVLEMLNIISDDTIDEAFVETWVYPWVKFQLTKAIAQIDSIDVIEDVEYPGRYIPSIVFKPGYGTLFEVISGIINYTHFWGSYFFHYRAYQRPAEAFSSFVFPEVAGYGTPWLHDYPIGRDTYLHAWWLAIRSGLNEKILVSPEGFYAGTHDLFYTTQPIPETSIYSVGDPEYTELLNKDRYFVSKAWGRSTDPVSIIKNAKYSVVNKPPSNCLAQLRVDVVGHINGGQTTHEDLYKTAYEKTLTWPNPGVRVTTITTSGSYYRYEYIYEGNFDGNYRPIEPSYPELQTEVARLDYNPLLNGSMLFSK